MQGGSNPIFKRGCYGCFSRFPL